MRNIVTEKTGDNDTLGPIVTGVLRNNGYITGSQGYISSLAHGPESEERNVSGQDPNMSSPIFDRNRAAVMAELRAIMDDTFKEYEISPKNGLDIGSGATGTMVNRLLPVTAQNWIQSDLNPNSNTMNRRLHPSAKVVDASMFHLLDRFGSERFDTVTGLSSIDGTMYLPEVMKQVSAVLKPNGYFVHFQDVRPGFSPIVSYLDDLKIAGPYFMENLVGSNNAMDLASVNLPNEGFVGVGEIFRRRVQQVLEAQDDMEILYNGWVNARAQALSGFQAKRLYYMNISLQVQGNNLERGGIASMASGVVTVARKVKKA